MNRTLAPQSVNNDKKSDKDPDRVYLIDEVLARLIGIKSMKGTRK